MHRSALLLFTFLLVSVSVFAKKKHKPGNTEQGIIYKLEACLAHKDAYAYMDLFPDLDTLTKLAMQYSDTPSRDFQEAARLQGDPVKMMHADSIFRANLKQIFDSAIHIGELQDIHWEDIVPVRYEMIKQRETRARVYEKMAPTRFTGYIFFMDRLTHHTYGMRVSDILQMQGEWYGGFVEPPFEGSTIDEYKESRTAFIKTQKGDSLVKKEVPIPTGEQNENSAQKIIAEKKFYAGMFDNEIPVQLYLRSLKGSCPAGICSWEAIYKFGDNDEYIRLIVTRTEDGKWNMVEDPPAGSMELTLTDKVFTGAWTASDSQTGYDVKLTELPASDKKIARLDAAFMEIKKKKVEN